MFKNRFVSNRQATPTLLFFRPEMRQWNRSGASEAAQSGEAKMELPVMAVTTGIKRKVFPHREAVEFF